jgi:hypothetical protein
MRCPSPTGLGQPWHGGPYSEPARQLLARHAPLLGRALARFDELVREAAGSEPVVITHGEPHPGNILRAAGGMYLIDWDTVGLRCQSVTCGWWPVTMPAPPTATPSSPGAGSAASPCTCTGCAGAWTTFRSIALFVIIPFRAVIRLVRRAVAARRQKGGLP